LVAWKRIDRGLAIAASLAQKNVDFAYLIVGGGDERGALERRANELGIGDRVKFTGPVPQSEIFGYMNAADVFISTYDMSNVGNPLLEAIRMGKVVVTLNNGDTGSWITHNVNGLIYDISEDLPSVAAHDIARLVSDRALRDRLEGSVRGVASERLWTWHDRLLAEVTEVENLVEK
jgi:glycosyltransferase involved in cell wall biosynthesis